MYKHKLQSEMCFIRIINSTHSTKIGHVAESLTVLMYKYKEKYMLINLTSVCNKTELIL